MGHSGPTWLDYAEIICVFQFFTVFSLFSISSFFFVFLPFLPVSSIFSCYYWLFLFLTIVSPMETETARIANFLNENFFFLQILAHYMHVHQWLNLVWSGLKGIQTQITRTKCSINKLALIAQKQIK